jgi:TPR repeat protein
VGEACWRLAAMYERGAGVRRNPEEVTANRRRACQLGYAAACPVPKGP